MAQFHFTQLILKLLLIDLLHHFLHLPIELLHLLAQHVLKKLLNLFLLLDQSFILRTELPLLLLALTELLAVALDAFFQLLLALQ